MNQAANLGKDSQLKTRMYFTMIMLGVLYGAFVFVALQFNPFMLILVAGIALVQVLLSDRMVLASMKAKVVSPEEAPRLHAMIDRLSQQAGIPKPKVAIANLSVPNAFATGRSQKSAAVAVTQGLLNVLDEEELEGVLAHEISHIKTRDVVVMTYASFFLIVAAMLSTFLFFSAIFGGMRRNGGNGGMAILVMILVVAAVRIIGNLLVSALSRYREYSADRGASALTHKPMALASALQTLQGSISRTPKQDLRHAEGMNAFFIMSAVGNGVAELFASHPSTEKRIQRLREYDRALTLGR